MIFTMKRKVNISKGYKKKKKKKGQKILSKEADG